MLAVSGGRIILLSTPFGKRGFFHHEWTEGGPEWERVMVTAEQVPYADWFWTWGQDQGLWPAQSVQWRDVGTSLVDCR